MSKPTKTKRMFDERNKRKQEAIGKQIEASVKDSLWPFVALLGFEETSRLVVKVLSEWRAE
ncbi:MAG: hypothetical protein ACJ8C4_18600 [Gemmataceae bacterium]